MTTEPHEADPSGQALLANARLEEFVIENVLGSGGFGITYLAKDTSLGRKVVIKENLPAQFAWRETTTGTVRPRHTSGGDVDDFAWSMNNFLREAETLASLDHAGIVRVLRKFEANGTAYFVMPFVEGKPFDALIESRRKKEQMFSEVELGGLLSRMLEALGYLHEHGIYHRDIKPANILVTLDGVPVLIDFGSARQRLSDHSMTVVESAGYTPFEQLQSQGNVGPWSDLYALGATIVKAITFQALPKANDRIRKDPHVPLAQRADLTSRFSARFLRAIDKATAVDEEVRWQDARQWLGAMSGKWEDEQQAEEAPQPAAVATPVDEPTPLPPTDPSLTYPIPRVVPETDAPPTPAVPPWAPQARLHGRWEKEQEAGKRKSARGRAIIIGAAALVVVGVLIGILTGRNQAPPQGGASAASNPQVDAGVLQQREAARVRLDADKKEQAKREDDARQRQAAANEAREQSKREAEALAVQQRAAERLQENAEAAKQARLADDASKRQAAIPRVAKDPAIPEEEIDNHGNPPGARQSSTSLILPKSEIIDRYKLGNPNNLGPALAKANELQTNSEQLAKSGREQSQTPDFVSPLNGRYSSAENIRRKGAENINKAQELKHESDAIRSGVSDIKKYLQSEASDAARTKIHEILSKDGRKIMARIIGSLDKGVVIQKSDGEFMLVNMNQLADKSAQYVNEVVSSRK